MPDILKRESWPDKLRRATDEYTKRNEDPYVRVLERALPPDGAAVSTVMVANLLGLSPTTGNARRIAKTMYAMGYFPLRSRKLLPGGWRQTVARGWVRPVRSA